MDPAGTPTQAQIEAAVRAYVARVARRYLPLLTGVVVLLLIVVLVPTTSQSPRQPQFAQGLTSNGATGTGVTAGAVGSSGVAPAAAGGSGAAANAGAVAAGAAGGHGAASTAAGSGGGGATVAAGQPATGSTTGIARSGMHCGRGKRQVSWSVYAPPCVAKFTGNNGGATSRGVTATSITLSYRVSTSADDAAISAATGDAAPPKDSDYLADLRTYADYFNKQFELYGRSVVIRSFNGQGDYIQEDQGQGADRAQADAATAHAASAFGDVTFQLRGSNPYWSALAQQGIVAWGPLGFPSSYYQRYAPYWWSYTPSGTSVAGWMSSLTCRRMAGLDAIFAPDATYQHTVRKFGLVHPNNPEYTTIANDLKQRLSACGVPIAREVNYSINVAQYQSEATSIVAQMRSAGVTTVLCYCDPVVPIFLGNAAQSQQYRPEWVQPYWGDPQARQPENGNWGGVIANAPQWPAASANEAYAVFKLASRGAEPREKYYAAAYATLMQVYMGLQTAGPTLTPQALQRGYQSLPATGAGQAGAWTFQGTHVWTPEITTAMGWYDGTYQSQFDGKKGGYRSCDGGKLFSFDDPSTWAGPHQQMHCFGK